MRCDVTFHAHSIGDTATGLKVAAGVGLIRQGVKSSHNLAHRTVDGEKALHGVVWQELLFKLTALRSTDVLSRKTWRQQPTHQRDYQLLEAFADLPVRTDSQDEHTSQCLQLSLTKALPRSAPDVDITCSAPLITFVVPEWFLGHEGGHP